MDNQKLQCLFKGSFSFSKSSFLVSMLNFQGVDIGSPVELSKRKSPWSCSWCKHLQKQCVVCRNNVGFPKLFMDWTENYLHTKQLRPSWDPKLIALDRTSQQLHCHDFPTKIPGTKAPEKPSKRFAMQTLRWETKRWWTKKHQKTPKECVIFGTLFLGLWLVVFKITLNSWTTCCQRNMCVGSFKIEKIIAKESDPKFSNGKKGAGLFVCGRNWFLFFQL